MIQPKVKKILSKRFTFMLVPHGGGNMKRFELHLSHVLILLAVWTGITFWGSYLSAQHIDYWRTRLANQVLTLKVNYLSSQLDQSRGFLDEVKQIDNQLRSLLQYKDESTLIQNSSDKNLNVKATGGPSVSDQKDLASLLKNSEHDISWDLLVDKVGLYRNETQQRITSFEDISSHIQTQKHLF